MPTVPLTYHRADISGGGWLRKLETNPSRFYVGKFVPDVPAPWRDIRGPRKSSEADSSPPTQNNDCLQGSYL